MIHGRSVRHAALLATTLAVNVGAATVAFEFVQAHPRPLRAGAMARTEAQTRAVVLIHGLRASALTEAQVVSPHFHDWQRAGSGLVEKLGADSDVYAFSYAQDVALDAVSAGTGLDEAVAKLRDLGYRSIILVGHSAGGLLAREFVEDHPDAGVTKVIQVCSPNEGSRLGRLDRLGPRAHRDFLLSLSDRERRRRLDLRRDKRVPPSVEFVCVVGIGAEFGDLVVRTSSQWPADLRAQGVPAVMARTTHFSAMRSPFVAKTLVRLVVESQPRVDSRAADAR